MAVANRGLSSGAMEEEEDQDQKKKKKGKSKSIMDMMGGGGGLVGTGLSIGAGLVDRNAQKKAAERADPRPKRRNVARGMEIMDEGRRKREAGLATLSQAMMDWSRALR